MLEDKTPRPYLQAPLRFCLKHRSTAAMPMDVQCDWAHERDKDYVHGRDKDCAKSLGLNCEFVPFADLINAIAIVGHGYAYEDQVKARQTIVQWVGS